MDSSSENKKIARFLEHPLVVKSKVEINMPSVSSNQDSNSAENGESEQKSNKRQRESVSPAKSNKRQKTKEKGDATKKMLKCTNCDHKEVYSPKIHSLNFNLVSKIGWLCIKCKHCMKCKKSDNDSKLMICDYCDRTFHCYCLTPPLDDVPSTAWFCEDCKKRKAGAKVCDGCQTPLDSKEKVQVFKGQRACQQCFKFYKDCKYCKLCMCTYDENNTTHDFVFCDSCE